MPKYIKDGKIIVATQKAYEVVYKALGYKECEDNKKDDNEINYDELTVKELEEIAKERDIKGYYEMKKDELIKALRGE